MAAHIATPNVTNDGLPASLSYSMLTEKLRGELGYDGVIITDALAMGAIIQELFFGRKRRAGPCRPEPIFC